MPIEGRVDHTSMGKLGQDTCLDTDGQKIMIVMMIMMISIVDIDDESSYVNDDL